MNKFIMNRKVSKISVIIAVLNEEETIGEVIDDIKKHLKKIHLDSEIIVVDNGSKDNTRNIVLSKEVKLIEKKKRGKGEAVLAGIEKASGDILLFIDGDNTYPENSIPEMIYILTREDKDVVYGSRFLRNYVKMSFTRYMGNKLLSLLASLLYKPTTDLLTGMVAVKKDKIVNLNLNSRGFEIETEFFIKSVIENLQTVEMPITYKQRKKSKLNPVVDGIIILKTLLKYKL